MKFSKFQTGSSVYRCHVCNKMTRDTGRGENDGLDMCAKCLFEAYVENAESDYGTDSDQYRDAVEALNNLNVGK